MKSYKLIAEYAFLISLDSTATSDPGVHEDKGMLITDFKYHYMNTGQIRVEGNSLSTHYMTEKRCFEQQNSQYLIYQVDVFPNRRTVLTGRWQTVLARLRRTTAVWRLTPRRWVWALKQWPMHATPHLATRFSQCYTAPKHKVFSI